MNLKLGVRKTMSSIEKATSTQNEKLDNLGITELTQVLKPKQVDFKLPDTIYIYHMFFGSGAIIIGYCFWSIYQLF
jgi:hypothetical protein